MFRLSKEILSGTPEGKQEMEDLVQGIIDQLSQEDYEDSVSTDYEEESDTIEPPRRERTTPSREPQVELDVDTILDKISSSGMGSLTKRERDFLNNLKSLSMACMYQRNTRFRADSKLLDGYGEGRRSKGGIVGATWFAWSQMRRCQQRSWRPTATRAG